jgi:urease accessory protein
MNALLLLLLDSRAPAGNHNHSGGMEAAVSIGLVAGLADTEKYCRARLRTSGKVAAAFAAAACGLQLSPTAGATGMALLDAELDARTASQAARAASRQLGAGLQRLLRSMLPGADLMTPWAGCGQPAPHQPLVLGSAVGLAGGTPELAARAAALAACAGPASAAVRLLGLDPYAVQAMLARLAPRIDECADLAATAATGPPQSLPCDAAPALDLLPDFHLTAEVRLFAS